MRSAFFDQITQRAHQRSRAVREPPVEVQARRAITFPPVETLNKRLFIVWRKRCEAGDLLHILVKPEDGHPHLRPDTSECLLYRFSEIASELFRFCEGRFGIIYHHHDVVRGLLPDEANGNFPITIGQ